MAAVATSTSFPVAGAAAEPAPAPDLAAVLDAHAAVRTSLGLAGQARSAAVPGVSGTGEPSPPPDDEVISNVSVSSGVVAVGADHTCALGPFGDVWCFGAGDDGQLGVGEGGDGSVPQRASADGALAGLATVAVSAGTTHTCAIAMDPADESEPTVYCWGGNDHGQVGDGSTDAQDRPVEVMADAIRVVTGAHHSCALLNTGNVYCWGANDVGQLGLGSTGADEPTPQQVPGLTGVLDVSANGDTTCVVVKDATAKCWGSDSDGQLGDGDGDDAAQSSPVAVDTSDISGDLAKIAVGGKHVCALSSLGNLYCWGADDVGQLGTATGVADVPAPVAVAAKGSFFDVTAGGDSSCAVDVNGQAYCWGDNSDGQLGVGDSDNRDEPAKVDQGAVRSSPITQLVLGVDEPLLASVSMAGSHACGVDVQGTVYCWGSGAGGQLGTGDTASSNVPVGTVLTPEPPGGVRVSAGDQALGTAWSAPEAPGVAPVKEYAALAAAGSGVEAVLDLESCSTTTALSCRIENLENKQEYEVFVGAATDGGVSFSESTQGVPQASGAGGSLPITGAGVARLVAMAAALIAAGVLGMMLGRRRRHRSHRGSIPS